MNPVLETRKGIDDDVNPLQVNGPMPEHEDDQPLPNLTDAPLSTLPAVSYTLTVIASVLGRIEIVAVVPESGEMETFA